MDVGVGWHRYDAQYGLIFGRGQRVRRRRRAGHVHVYSFSAWGSERVAMCFQPLRSKLKPVCGPKGDDVVIEVIASVMKRAATHAVTIVAVIAFAVADPYVASG